MKNIVNLQLLTHLDEDMPLYDEQIEHCLQAFTHFYRCKQYTEAFEQLWLAISLFENSTNTDLKIKLLRSATMCAPYFIFTEDSQTLLEAIVAHESANEQPEILSMCYFLLSMNALQLTNAETAVNYSKLAYFYAKNCIEDERFYECNAQLQLVSSLIEAASLEDAQNYIDKFQWYLENCQNVQEQILITSIHATKTLLEGDTAVATSQITHLLQKFSHADEMMYTSYLALHFKRMLTKFNPCPSALALCDQVIGRFLSIVPQLQEVTKSSYTTHSQLFYTRASSLVLEQIKATKQTAIHKFAIISDTYLITDLMTCLESLPCDFVVHSYAPNRYAIVTCEIGHELLLQLYEEQQLTMLASICKHLCSKKQFFVTFYSEINLPILTQSFSNSTVR